MSDFNANGGLPFQRIEGYKVKPFSGTNSEQFDGWRKTACFTFSIARPDVFHMLEGQAMTSIMMSGRRLRRKTSLSSNVKPRIELPIMICLLSSI